MTVRIVLKDGSVLVGRILRQDSSRIVLRTRGGAEATVPAEAVAERERLSLPGAACRSGRDDVRLFLMPTAKTLPRGCSYLGVYEILFPHVAAGITGRFTLAGGITFFPTWVYVAPKIGLIQKSHYQFAVGGVATLVSFYRPFHYLYGVVTVDWWTTSVTVGLLHSLGPRSLAVPPLVFGAQVSEGKSVMFVTENYVDLGKHEIWPGFGLRFVGKHVSADLAFQVRFEDSRPWMLPWVAFTYAAE